MPASPALHPQNQRQQPTKTGSPQEPGKSLAVEMTHLEIPQQTRDFHIPTATTTTGYRGLDQHQTKINTKINTKAYTNNKTKVVYTDNLTHPSRLERCPDTDSTSSHIPSCISLSEILTE